MILKNQDKSLAFEKVIEEAPLKTNEKRKLLLAGSLGSFLEIFDFTIYSFFAGTIGEVFFQSKDPLFSLFLSVSVFATGFIMRPLGSIFIGGYCDKKGRKSGIFLSIILMGLGSSMIAFAPSYQMIGIMAPILIIIGRLLQGFSAGGQIAAAGSLLMESAPKKQRGYFVSWQFIVQGISSLFGGFFAFLIYSNLSSEQVLSWGWRLPFLFSLLIIPVGFYIRAHIKETHNAKEKTIKEHPFKNLIKYHKGRTFKLIMMYMPGTVVTYIMIFYMPHYLVVNHIIQAADRYLISVYASILVIVSTFLSGLFCDKFERRLPLILFSYAVNLIFSYFTFYFINNLYIFFISYSIVAFFQGLSTIALFLFLAENYEQKIRVTAVGVVYSVAVALFGGPAQMIVTALLEWSNKNLMAPFWYVGFSLIMGIIFGSLIKKNNLL